MANSSTKKKRPFTAALSGFWSRAAAFAAAWAYFKYWDRKTQLKNIVRTSSLAVFSISGMLLVFHIGSEVVGTNRINSLFSLVDAHPKIKLLLELVFIFAALYGVIHHVSEMRRPAHEFKFVQVLCDLLEHQRVTGKRELRDALQLCFGVFEHRGIKHVALSLPQRAGDVTTLTIDPQHVYPKEKDSGFFVSMPVGEGIAGQVIHDSNPRYVPRLFFPFGRRRWGLPTWPFPHAIRYEYHEKETLGRDGQSVKLLELGEQEPDLDCVKGDQFLFSSFLSVPVEIDGDEGPRGVMNLDFGRLDPLGRPEILMAVALARSLASQLPQYQWLTKKPEGH